MYWQVPNNNIPVLLDLVLTAVHKAIRSLHSPRLVLPVSFRRVISLVKTSCSLISVVSTTITKRSTCFRLTQEEMVIQPLPRNGVISMAVPSVGIYQMKISGNPVLLHVQLAQCAYAVAMDRLVTSRASATLFR